MIVTDGSDGSWPIVSSLAAGATIGRRFAWGGTLDDRAEAMPDRIATWMTLIDAGARVLITDHVVEAKRVAVMASDLLERRAVRGEH